MNNSGAAAAAAASPPSGSHARCGREGHDEQCHRAGCSFWHAKAQPEPKVDDVGSEGQGKQGSLQSEEGPPLLRTALLPPQRS